MADLDLREDLSTMDTLKKISLLEHLISLILFFIFVLIIVQIVLRFGFRSPLTWSEELSRYLLIWLTFLGGSVATKQKSHLVIGANLTKNLPEKAQHWVIFLINILVTGVVVVLLLEGLKLCRNTLILTAISMPIPMAAVWFTLPLNALIMLRYIVPDLFKSLKKIIRG